MNEQIVMVTPAKPTSGENAVKAFSALTTLLSSFSRQGRDLFERYAPRALRGKHPIRDQTPLESCEALAHALVSVRGEASGVAMARDLMALYHQLELADKAAFFGILADKFDPDPARLNAAWQAYQLGGNACLPALAQALESPRLELFRRLNLAPGSTLALVRMRSDLLGLLRGAKGALDRVDADLASLLAAWFNRGFLSMQTISWESPARLLDSVTRYEAVHDIRDWDDLRRRLDPADRRCFAFFHPAMPDEPLIFVEVALTKGIPGNIQDILAPNRTVLDVREADTAVFYSISNCQDGLKGISFGHFLIKQVATDLQRDLPNLSTFVTLSPIPGFMAWLRKSDDPHLQLLEAENWAERPDNPVLHDWLLRRAVRYFTEAKNDRGRPLDPVARFHLGNGARLERLNWLGDFSANGIRQSAGLMVNYLYDLTRIEENHEAYAERGEMVIGPIFREMQQELDGKQLNTGGRRT